MGFFSKLKSTNIIDSQSYAFVKVMCIFASLANTNANEAYKIIISILDQAGLSTKGMSESIVNDTIRDSNKIAAIAKEDAELKCGMSGDFILNRDVIKFFDKINKSIEASSNELLLSCCAKYVGLCGTVDLLLNDTLSHVGAKLKFKDWKRMTSIIENELPKEVHDKYTQLMIEKMKRDKVI